MTEIAEHIWAKQTQKDSFRCCCCRGLTAQACLPHKKNICHLSNPASRSPHLPLRPSASALPAYTKEKWIHGGDFYLITVLFSFSCGSLDASFIFETASGVASVTAEGQERHPIRKRAPQRLRTAANQVRPEAGSKRVLRIYGKSATRPTWASMRAN